MMKRLFATAVLSVLGFSAQAQTDDGKHLRFGLAAGSVNYDYTYEDPTSSLSFDQNATEWQIFVGYEFNKWLAVEAGWINLLEAEQTYTGPAASATIGLKAKGWTGSVLGSFWVNDFFSFYGRAGLLAHKETASVSYSFGGGESLDDDGTDPYFGVGIAASLDGALLRLEYNVADIDDLDVTMIGASIAWRF